MADVIRLVGGGTYIICNDRDALELVDERLGMDMRRWMEDRISEDDGAEDYILRASAAMTPRKDRSFSMAAS